MRDSSGDTRMPGVRCLRISPDGQTLATGDRSGNIRFVSLNYFPALETSEIRPEKFHTDYVAQLYS